MASMVAKFSVTNCIEATSPVLDKVSRKKRKFRADIPQSDFTENESLFESYFPRQFPPQEPESIPIHCENGFCKVCGDCDHVSSELEVGLPGITKEETRLCIPEKSGWDDLSEIELKKLVLRVMDATFKSAIKKIVDCGYPEKLAIKALMRPGLCYGSKDTLSNMVDNSLAFLQTYQDMERPIRYSFKDMNELETYLLAEFVSALQAHRRSFSPAEALWYLLFFDMDVSHACFVIGGQYKHVEDGQTIERSYELTQHQLNTHIKLLDFNLPTPCASTQSELPVHLIKEPETVTNHDTIDSNTGEMRFTETVGYKFSAAASTPLKYFAGGGLCNKKPHSLSTLRKVSTREQKWKHVDKGRRKCGQKGVHKTGRMPGWTSDRRKDCTELPLPKVTCAASSSAAEFNLSFSSALKKEHLQASASSYSDVNIFKYNESFIEDVTRRTGSRDLDTGIVLQLATRAQIWQNNLKEWTEWANIKVLQATRRLLKNKPELNKLRQEKLEADRLEQEKKSLKENITKKLCELENAVYKTSGKVNVANSAIRRLETDNVTLRQEMEAAQFQAAKAAANCQEAFTREREGLLTVQTYAKQKGFLQDDLNAEKVKTAEAQQQLKNAVSSLSRLEAKWSMEAKAKEEFVRKATLTGKEIEQLKALGKTKEEAIISKTASTLKKYEDDVKELQREISKLSLKSNSSTIAVMKRGIDKSHVRNVTDSRTSPTDRKSQVSVISKYSQDCHTTNSNPLVKRHRECVMCLEEEMSVVFLPCAHQVLCTKCNVQHKKNGMKDCPSCRSTIERRIAVRYAVP